MKIALVGVAVLVGLVLLIAVVGSLLPKKHMASRKITLKRPAQEVWSAITDPAALQSGEAAVMIVEQQAPKRLVTKIADENLPYGGTWTYEIEPHETGTQLKITENGEVKNVIFRFMSKFIFGHNATLDGYLKALAKKFGEETSPG